MQIRRSSSVSLVWLAMLAALCMVAAACGGDDDESGTPTQVADEVDSAGDIADAADGDSSEEANGGGGEAGASVSIDGVTYEADVEVSCLAASGFLGAAFRSDDSTIQIDVSLSAEGDDEPSSVRVDDETDPDDQVQFEAGGDIVDSNAEFRAVAQVNDYRVDGRSATGSATFIDTTELMSGSATPVDGTFEVRCAAL